LIIITNVRTLFSVWEAGVETRVPVYATLALIWMAAIAIVVRHHRRDGLPLLNTTRATQEPLPARAEA
jgi:hypothetical protein